MTHTRDKGLPVPRNFTQLTWDQRVREACQQLVHAALAEDLGGHVDITSHTVIGPDCEGQALIVARQEGIVCGLAAAQETLRQVDESASWEMIATDGQPVAAQQTLARVAGTARSLLTAERTMLNLLGRLSGISTLTNRYTECLKGTRARVYDTRKTTPGWRLLEKYAVGTGGGRNHRTGLFDAVLIKDNHLAIVASTAATPPRLNETVERARRQLGDLLGDAAANVIVEVEVDTLEQLRDVLSARPDIVLLDNMDLVQLRAAVTLRDQLQPETELEASGGVTLNTIRAIAETGVERISVGALTHSAQSLDVAMDWQF